MALSQIHPVNPGDRIESAVWNAEFQNILSHPVDLISPSTGAINFAGQAHTGLPPTAITATSGTAGQVLLIGSGGTAAWGSLSGGSGVRGLQGTLTSQTGTFTADQYVLQATNGTGNYVLNSTAAFTVNLGTAGPAANGRDIAGNFASTYVHWYAISTGANSTSLAGIASTATPPIGPVMPSSYSAWTYLGGSLYSSSSTALTAPHYFRGAWAHYSPAVSEVTNGNSTAETAVSMALAAPSNHLESQHAAQCLLLPGTGQQFFLRVVSGSNYHVTSTTASSVTALLQLSLRIPNISNQFFWLLSSQLASANDGVQMSLQGYKMPNGDV